MGILEFTTIISSVLSAVIGVIIGFIFPILKKHINRNEIKTIVKINDTKIVIKGYNKEEIVKLLEKLNADGREDDGRESEENGQ